MNIFVKVIDVDDMDVYVNINTITHITPHYIDSYIIYTTGEKIIAKGNCTDMFDVCNEMRLRP